MDMSRSGALGLPVECLWKHQPAFYLQPLRQACPPRWEVNMLSWMCYDSCVSPHRFQGRRGEYGYRCSFSSFSPFKDNLSTFFLNVNLMIHCFIDWHIFNDCIYGKTEWRKGENTLCLFRLCKYLQQLYLVLLSVMRLAKWICSNNSV